MKLMWDEVERQFDASRASDLLPPSGHHFAPAYALRALHPQLPYTVCFREQGQGRHLSNVVSFCMNINYSQARRSSLTGQVAASKLLDAGIRDLVREAVEKAASH